MVLRSKKTVVRFRLKHSKKYLLENRYQDSSIGLCFPLNVLRKELVTPQDIGFHISIEIIKNST